MDDGRQGLGEEVRKKMDDGSQGLEGRTTEN